MNHYLKYHFYTKDGSVITKVIQISSRELLGQIFPSRDVFGIEVFDSDSLSNEFSNYTGKDLLNKNFYSLVTNVQKFMIGEFVPFEKCKTGRFITAHDIKSGKKWGLTGFCVNNEQYMMVGPNTIVLSPTQVKFAEIEQC